MNHRHGILIAAALIGGIIVINPVFADNAHCSRAPANWKATARGAAEVSWVRHTLIAHEQR